MNKELTKRWNERVKPEDTVLFLGDFCFRNSLVKRGEGDLHKFDYYRSKLNGNIVFVAGNHDKSNSTNTHILSMIVDFGKHLFLCQHRPIDNLNEVPDFVDIVLCGHIHEKWRYKWKTFPEDKDPRLVINVSTDVWNFYPVRMIEICGYITRILNGKEKEK